MDDTISRQAAIDALEKEKPTPFVNEDGSIDPFGAGQQNQWYRDGIAIMNMPSAQPERKKGKWEFIGGYGYQYRCSACITCAEHKTNFCPNCGAEMEGEE